MADRLVELIQRRDWHTRRYGRLSEVLHRLENVYGGSSGKRRTKIAAVYERLHRMRQGASANCGEIGSLLVQFEQEALTHD